MMSSFIHYVTTHKRSFTPEEMSKELSINLVVCETLIKQCVCMGLLRGITHSDNRGIVAYRQTELGKEWFAEQIQL
ncbi:hypothetical protein COU80_04090 [Candidatus Peregrinibacteria bacterium CG10_big_fil_rev_8_21_14_0_10_55_24]|nr:MAG: hypothetical protein COU80_04090 [Candidatus Peregrinibacteria bacterium CG10_big_fil_rev_8_21_14_0_10_55_24]